MAPSKRAKKSSSRAELKASPASAGAQDPDEPLVADYNTLGKNKPASSATTGPEGTAFVDSALLDEEEMPDQTEKQPAETREIGGYNALKSFNGQVYSGMAIGGSHTWNYDQGVWKEVKEEPDLWKIDYATTKRRSRNAPKGSGAPVGTEYHWLIVGHQHVKKIDANTYETHLTGSKYKLAHKTASSNSWSVPTVKGQRDREVGLLDDAKRRVQGLPPVSATEKVKVEKHEKGQQKLDQMFTTAAEPEGSVGASMKRKRED